MKKIIVIILAALDVILLGVIIVSLVTGWRIGGEVKTVSKPQVQEETTTEETTDREEETTTRKEKDTEEETKESETKSKKKKKKQQSEETTEETREETTQAQTPSYPSAENYSTSDMPSLADVTGFQWNAVDGGSWANLSPQALRLDDFNAVKGGWKAYILDDPSGVFSEYSIERFANIKISGTADAPEVLVDWFYVFFGETGEGQDDVSPDSAYSGTWDGGTVDAYGAGRIVLYNFYYDGDREYAVGAISWPDGVDGAIALVRP